MYKQKRNIHERLWRRRHNYIPANQSDFIVFVPIFFPKKGKKSEQYDFFSFEGEKKLAAIILALEVCIGRILCYAHACNDATHNGTIPCCTCGVQ